MKINSLEIVNLGKIEKIVVEINKPLILFFGEVKQGKTTILNSIKYCLGAKFPDDLLRHGTDKGHVLMKFDNSSIKRVFRRDKKGIVKANKIEFILNGILQEKPTDAIKQFLNPFLLDQDFFSRKSELERNRYFVELFDVDTSQIDKDITITDQAARDLRSAISAYGEIDITPVKKIDTYFLAKERQKIIDEYQKEKEKIRSNNEEIKDFNAIVFKKNAELIGISREIDDLRQKLNQAEKKYSECQQWLKDNKERDVIPEPSFPNTAEIDEKISEAKAQNERYKRYIENKERYDEKRLKQLELNEMETQLRELRSDKIKKLAEVSDKCNVPGLRFDENATAIYEDTNLGMLSMSQVMRLSSALSSLYPAGFGLELIDRGESLGKSIYGFIEKAKREDSAILATIVGEKPVQVPEDVGVWIVEEGKIK